jgi:hypothetical protein
LSKQIVGIRDGHGAGLAVAVFILSYRERPYDRAFDSRFPALSSPSEKKEWLN